MAKDYSFDVVCRTDMQEVANAVNQASKEIGTRYDFKGSKSSVTLDDGHITLIGDDDNPNIFLYEASEGSLGILSQIVTDLELFKDIVKEAIKTAIPM